MVGNPWIVMDWPFEQ